MAKTGAKNTKTLPLEHVNAGKRGKAWFNAYSQKNDRRAQRKEGGGQSAIERAVNAKKAFARATGKNG